MIVPLVALLLENAFIRLLFAFHDWLNWAPWFGTIISGATEALNTVEGLTTAFIVFTFGSLLIVIQVTSGQLAPRLIATTLLRNSVIRCTVGLFTFSLMFAVGTGARFKTAVPEFAVTIGWILGIVSIAAFLFLIDYTARLLLPVWAAVLRVPPTWAVSFPCHRGLTGSRAAHSRCLQQARCGRN